jgi:hypothetical protein
MGTNAVPIRPEPPVIRIVDMLYFIERTGEIPFWFEEQRKDMAVQFS